MRVYRYYMYCVLMHTYNTHSLMYIDTPTSYIYYRHAIALHYGIVFCTYTSMPLYSFIITKLKFVYLVYNTYCRLHTSLLPSNLQKLPMDPWLHKKSIDFRGEVKFGAIFPQHDSSSHKVALYILRRNNFSQSESMNFLDHCNSEVWQFFNLKLHNVSLLL